MTSMTRGPLPAGVYWRRRFFVLALTSTLVFLVASLLTGGGGEPAADGVASQAAAEPSPSDGPTTTSDEAATDKPKKKRKERPSEERTPEPPPLATPVGSCIDSDVQVSPTVESAVAGRPVTITLQLRTLVSEACTWRAGANHVTVKVTSGSDDIWSTRECPGAVPQREVVVRRDATSTLDVTWNARRSNNGCPGLSEYAGTGFYYVAAAALGGEPADVQFELQAPSPEVIVREPKRNQGKQKQDKQNPDQQNQGQQPGDGGQPSGAPSGAVEPN